MSSSSVLEPGLRVVRGAAEPLAAQLVSWLRDPPDDPFAQLTVCVESPGMQRWAAAAIGAEIGSAGAGDGVCAGVEFLTLRRLLHRVTATVSGLTTADDPWSASRLPWAVLTAFEAARGEPWFAVVERHLGRFGDPQRPGRAFAVAGRIAGLFRSYARHRPQLIRDWAAGRTGGVPEQHEWQARLWRALGQQVPVPDPVTRHDATLTALRAGGPLPGVPDRVAVLGPAEVAAVELEFLQAFGNGRPALVLAIGSPDPQAGSILLDRLGHHDRTMASALPATAVVPPGQPPATLLAAVQGQATGLRLPPVPIDDSIQIHLSHGPERQVEVLRELLTGALAADPTLEPRDIVVLCPDLATYAPLLTAALCIPAEAEPAHPGHGLRVRVVTETSPAGNPLLGLLVRLCDFVTSRVTAPDLLQLAAEPAVAMRFGFTADSLLEANALLWHADVRWGIDGDDRARFGLEGLTQGTLRAGLDRLLLGVALDESRLTTVGGVLPVAGIESSAVATVGALAELTARIERIAAAARGVRPAADWIELLQATITDFAAVPAAESWQLSAVAAVLADIRQAAAVSDAWLTLADVRAALVHRLRETSGRNAFGTGALTICGLRAQRHVPHRVVVLLGIDEHTFPRGTREDGDDLLALEPQPGDPDPRRTDRQLFLDALLSARERFVVVGRHRSPVTNEPVPLALPVLDLLDAVTAASEADVRGIVREHPLYPYSRAAAALPTFDAAAATALSAEAVPPPLVFDPHRPLPALPPGPLRVADLRSFVRSPLATFLRVRGGLTEYEPDQWAEELPLHLDGLQLWKIGDGVLRAALAGSTVDAAVAAQRARGAFPPYALGADPEARVRAAVEKALALAGNLPDAPPEHHDLRVDLGDRSVSGTVAVRGDTVCSVTYSKLNSTNTLDSYLQLLLLQAARPGTRWQAQLATPSDFVTWRLVDPEQALTHLRVLAGLYDIGLTSPLPVPVKVGYAWARAQFRAAAADPLEAARGEWRDKGWRLDRRAWERFFPDFGALRAAPVPGRLPDGVRFTGSMFETAARAIWEPVLGAQQR